MPFAFHKARYNTYRHGLKYKRSAYNRTKNRIMKTAYQVVKKFVNTEKKYFDVSQTAEIPDATTGTTNYTLSSIPQGTGESQRVGNQVKLTKVNARMTLFRNPSDTGDSRYVRIVMFVDNNSNGSVATVNDVLKSPTMTSFNDMQNKQRFKILMDKVVVLDEASATSGITISKYVDEVRKLVYSFDGDPPISGNVMISFFSNATSVNERPSLRLDTRIRYIDN